jgi:hypothetical protein
MSVVLGGNEGLFKHDDLGLISKAEDPREKLNIFMRQAFDLVTNGKDYFYVILDFWTQVNKNARMNHSNMRLFQSYRDQISEIIAEGIEKNFLAKMDIVYTLSVIIAMIQGLIIQYVIMN